MRVGLLWFNNSPNETLKQKIDGAVRAYTRNYGREPNVVYVNPAMMEGQEKFKCSVEILTSKSVLKSHFWVGEK